MEIICGLSFSQASRNFVTLYTRSFADRCHGHILLPRDAMQASCMLRRLWTVTHSRRSIHPSFDQYTHCCVNVLTNMEAWRTQLSPSFSAACFVVNADVTARLILHSVRKKRNYDKCGPIFNILSPADLAVNKAMIRSHQKHVATLPREMFVLI